MDVQAIIQAIILGIVQGFTEFLPVSSSGHLVLVQELLGIPYNGKAFDLVLHLGSLMAVLWYFRAELRPALKGVTGFLSSRLRRWPEAVEERVGCVVLLTTVPTAVAGFLIEPLVEPYLQGPALLAFMLGGFALVMAGVDHWAQRRENSVAEGRPVFAMAQLGWRHSLALGIAQALAFVPGVSRSGVSLTMARYLGLSRAEAARISMLMAIPVIGGAVAVKLASGAVSQLDVPREAVWLGVAASALCSFVSLRLLARLGNILQGCALYRLALALVLLYVTCL